MLQPAKDHEVDIKKELAVTFNKKYKIKTGPKVG